MRRLQRVWKDCRSAGVLVFCCMYLILKVKYCVLCLRSGECKLFRGVRPDTVEVHRMLCAGVFPIYAGVQLVITQVNLLVCRSISDIPEGLDSVFYRVAVSRLPFRIVVRCLTHHLKRLFPPLLC